jgi:lipopolysaccharide assembly protein A
VNYLIWLLKAAIFFTLFAFALNNQQAVAVNFFFGTFWKAPLVLVVLAAFGTGLALGVLLMMPRWWKKRKMHLQSMSGIPQTPSPAAGQGNATPPAGTADNPGIPRHGL